MPGRVASIVTGAVGGFVHLIVTGAVWGSMLYAGARRYRAARGARQRNNRA